MTDPKVGQAQDEAERSEEGKPELERERLKDLTPDDSEDVKGGVTTPAYRACECGSM